jgi:uncharacterized protein
MRIAKTSINDQNITQWPGGKTTELVIYPATSSYKERNFQFRISTAVIESDKSTFTKLPGYERVLMLLDGDITLKHKDLHSRKLFPFQKGQFKGDWDTESLGTGIDFNIMTSEDRKGDIVAIQLNKNDEKKINILEDTFCGIYVWQGQVDIEGHKIHLQEKDFAFLEAESGTEVTKITALENSILILAFVF